MTRQENDFLREIKRQALKYLISYIFVSLGLLIGFYIDTKIQINALNESQRVLKERQTEYCQKIDGIIQMHLTR